MSCGKPHEVPCSEVLAVVYHYLDGELDQRNCSQVQEHLDECGPCLREFGLEESVKRLVGKHCGCDPVPPDLRAKVLGKIEQVQAELSERPPAEQSTAAE
ncbi:mycothiol system anti-sigma-R factor [Allonocardiopsis opalescens]|uniref:Mycothiol system anti-sigma-R factor n=1 Tax=Allonocardiopsis opalescens TaxID=1144618 RepID=A0A2T0QDN6_9ACTN|nr:mycothiol system anti-sigma-R factor [Allonocardiopsis opalescens]PRY02047.1 mycothiol system anti-sigma-R factor [Allonocardiopsis opalescens]